jgi:ribonuclease R
MPIDESEVLEHLSSPGYEPCKAKPLAKELGIGTREYKAFRSLLSELEKEGKVTRLKGGRWARAGDGALVSGTLQVARRGFGFLLPDDPRLDDIFIPERELDEALNGDRIAVRVEKRRGRDHRRFGRVIRILERARDRFVGTVEIRRGAEVFHPEDERLPRPIEIEHAADAPEAAEGDKVLLEMIRWPERGAEGSGRILERLGPAGAPDTEVAAILANYEAPGPFPEEVLEEVRALTPGIPEAEREARLDLTGTVTFTIDPADARDYDDAISVERVQDGYRLGVHIADVSHYVFPGTKLDDEAKERSTSIYLPERVIPMLPEELSNDACSLRPDEDRPALSVFMDVDADGKVTSSRIGRSVIRSHKRFSYEEAYTLLEDDAEAEAFEDKEVLSALRMLRTVAGRMRTRRFEEGSVELDLPEYRVLIDENDEAVGMQLVEHDFSHQMIEDCMLAANVEVARYAARHTLPILYRVHDQPTDEDIESMIEFLQAYGYGIRRPFSRKRLNQVLRQAAGRPEAHAVNLAVLKSMQQAVYSADLREHFALAFERYTHFTSPIRRYPDLHLHQVLKSLFPEGEPWLPGRPKLGNRARGSSPDLHLLGTHTSARERRAMKIENEVKDLRRIELLAKSEKTVHKAVVTGIHRFGVFVELEDYFVDSLLAADELRRHGLEPVEVMPEGTSKKKKGKRRQQPEGFHLGQEVLVRVVQIDMPGRSVEVEYAGDPAQVKEL